MHEIRADRTCSSDDMVADTHTHTLITILHFHIDQSLFVANEKASATTYELERRANDTSEHIRFYLLVFSFFLHFLTVGSVR